MKQNIQESSNSSTNFTIIILVILGTIGLVLMSLYTIGNILEYTEKTMDILVWCFTIDCTLLLIACISTIILHWGLPTIDEDKKLG